MTSTTTTFLSTQLFQDFLGKIHSRKLLQSNQQPLTVAAAPSPYSGVNNAFDSNVVMVLSFLLCATICAIGLNFLIKCVLRSCSTSVSDSGHADLSTRKTNKGIKQKALKTFPVVKYSADLKLPGLDTECAICLSEFVRSERVRLLPKCNHGFHVRCIDKWLGSHSSCPKCRNCLIETCQKIIGSGPSMPVQETIVTVSVSGVVPLEPGGMVPNYSGLS
ncbi:hypothetical protein LWI28_004901 [Acer negundo]|uniref:RING-type E3 ubiquitin transferase n=1 Tax=Acer negundo TaxID=4023 RepID=A0AAD5IIE7_ACENE|nr:hypothetical protein LWI28_004901 [Acer negundo]